MISGDATGVALAGTLVGEGAGSTQADTEPRTTATTPKVRARPRPPEVVTPGYQTMCPPWFHSLTCHMTDEKSL